MENASKALLIAGAILLVIAIIAIAVGIVSSTRGTIGSAENQIDSMAIQMHNKQFEVYEGKLTYKQVKELFSLIIANNSKTQDNNFIITTACYRWQEGRSTKNYWVYNGQTDLTDPEVIAYKVGQYVALTTEPYISNLYDCELFYNSQGIINKIYVTGNLD
ncbi:MAG: hypothetical protein E7311_06035 [Clostridiales bacterium]|nr:hypothetical protein [Clostridiales bacterium]